MANALNQNLGGGVQIAQLGERQTLDHYPHPGRSVVSLSKTLHPHCLVLVKPRKPSQNDRKIVDRDVNPQTNKQTLILTLSREENKNKCQKECATSTGKLSKVLAQEHCWATDQLDMV